MHKKDYIAMADALRDVFKRAHELPEVLSPEDTAYQAGMLDAMLVIEAHMISYMSEDNPAFDESKFTAHVRS